MRRVQMVPCFTAGVDLGRQLVQGSSCHDALTFLQKGQSLIHHKGFTGRNLEQAQAPMVNRG